MSQQHVGATRDHLKETVTSSLTNSEPHSAAFVARILKDQAYSADFALQGRAESHSGGTIYDGFPHVAAMGFLIDSYDYISRDLKERFLAGLTRLQGRSEAGLRPIIADDLAILGIACGLARLSASNTLSFTSLKDWTLKIVETPPRQRQWSYRMRELAGDLLDGRGRLKALPNTDDLSERALELVLRNIWREAFAPTQVETAEEYQRLMSDIIKSGNPPSEDLEESAVWLRALDIAIERLIRLTTLRNSDSAKALKMLSSIKDGLDHKATLSARLRIILSFVLWLAFAGIQAILTIKYGWDEMEPWTYFLDVFLAAVGYGYFALTNKELSPLAIYESLVAKQKQKLYREFRFDSEAYENLQSKANTEPALSSFQSLSLTAGRSRSAQ